MTRRTIIGFSLFGLVVFMLAVVTQLPAGIVTNLARESTAASALRLTAPQGTLWRGSARASIMQTDFGRFAWKVSLISLVTLSPQLDWTLQESGLSGHLERKAGTMNAALSGSLDIAQLAPILSRYAIAAEGRLGFNDFRITQTRDALSLSGRIDWTGGSVDLGIGNWQGRQTLPALRAEAVNTSHLRITLLDVDTNTRLPAGEIELMDDGWVKFGVTGHLADHFGQPLGNATNRSEIVLAVEERLL